VYRITILGLAIRGTHTGQAAGFKPQYSRLVKKLYLLWKLLRVPFLIFFHFMILQPVKLYDGWQIKFFTPFHKIIS
jgi:hypothetical protein